MTTGAGSAGVHWRSGPLFDITLIMKKLFALLIATIVLAGCNTVSGIGRDVQKVGQVVTGAGGK